MNGRKPYRRVILVGAMLLGAVAGMVTFVDSGYEITQMRNAFIAELGGESDYRWSPDEAPEGFLQDTGPPPEEFEKSVKSVLASVEPDADELERALALARHLASGPGAGGGIQSNTRDTYRTILTEGRGYCADYTQVLNGLAYAAGIPVREWGMSFDDYSGDGHAFTEIYLDRLDDWVVVDSFYSLYFVDAVSKRPLSALELRERLAAGEGTSTIEVRPIVAERFGFKSEEEALEYYRRGVDGFFLYFGTNVFSYDAHPIVSVLGPVSRALEETAGILLGIRPGIRLVPTGTNRSSIDALFRRRRVFIALGILATLLIVVFAVELLLRRRDASRAAV